MDKILGIDVGGQRIKLWYNNSINKIVSSKDLDKQKLLEIIKDFCKNINKNPKLIGISHPGEVENNCVVDGHFHDYPGGLSIDDLKPLGFEKAIMLNDADSSAFYASQKYNSNRVVAITF